LRLRKLEVQPLQQAVQTQQTLETPCLAGHWNRLELVVNLEEKKVAVMPRGKLELVEVGKLAAAETQLGVGYTVDIQLAVD
jgi:hypothetical protein